MMDTFKYVPCSFIAKDRTVKNPWLYGFNQPTCDLLNKIVSCYCRNCIVCDDSIYLKYYIIVIINFTFHLIVIVNFAFPLVFCKYIRPHGK